MAGYKHQGPWPCPWVTKLSAERSSASWRHHSLVCSVQAHHSPPTCRHRAGLGTTISSSCTPLCPRDADGLCCPKLPPLRLCSFVLFSITVCPLYLKTAVRRGEWDFSRNHHFSIPRKVLGGQNTLLLLAASPAIVTGHCHPSHRINLVTSEVKTTRRAAADISKS